jgi:hypothetical protein
MTVQILYHGNCFDGVVSSAIFTRFYRTAIDAYALLRYRGMGHGPGDPYGEDHDATFDAEVNVVLDFRYSPSPRLTWWCDHHVSTFIRPEHRHHLERNPSPRKMFDPAAASCAGLLARWLSKEHGFDRGPVAEHVRWADLIDSARFESPAQAVELREPALQLMTLLESGPAEPLVQLMIDGLTAGTIEDVHQHPEILRALAPVLEEHRETISLFRERMRVEEGVAYVDLSDCPPAGFNKFIPYHLAPDVRYTVVLTRSRRRSKVSVGSNPWDRPSDLVNIAELCARYGGGGHPVVGAVSFPPEELETARRASIEIKEVLQGRRP